MKKLLAMVSLVGLFGCNQKVQVAGGESDLYFSCKGGGDLFVFTLARAPDGGRPSAEEIQRAADKRKCKTAPVELSPGVEK